MDNPILTDFPYGFDTDRLTIRGPLPGDGAELHKAVVASLEALKPWMPWALDIPDERGYEARVREGQLKFLAREDLWMMLFLKGTNIIVGGSGLHRIDWAIPSFEIGYWIRTAFARKGYVTEAVEGISAFAFKKLGARRLEIRCDAKNVRSAAVARRAGFDHEGTLRRDSRHHLTGEFRDTLVFGKIEP